MKPFSGNFSFFRLRNLAWLHTSSSVHKNSVSNTSSSQLRLASSILTRFGNDFGIKVLN